VRIFLVGIFLVVLATAQADGLTDADVPAVTMTVSNCLEYIDTTIARLEALAETASNETARARCITDKLTKAHSLHELVHNLNDSLETHVTDDDEESAASNRTLILAACNRIDKLAEDAAACKDSIAPKPRRNSPPAGRATNPPQPRVVKSPAAPASAIRDETTCLKQVKFAAMLTEVMGVETGGNADSPSRELAKLAIEPLGGWIGDGCLTVDDLCVVVARALNLKVEKPEDPYSYVQAVRNDGLPVDSVLPRRRQEAEPALLLEAEVRSFLARGYAAHLPSGRRIQPD